MRGVGIAVGYFFPLRSKFPKGPMFLRLLSRHSGTKRLFLSLNLDFCGLSDATAEGTSSYKFELELVSTS